MSMSNAWSATIRFRRWFSFSSSFSRLASSAFMPPYWFFHRCHVDSSKGLSPGSIQGQSSNPSSFSRAEILARSACYGFSHSQIFMVSARSTTTSATQIRNVIASCLANGSSQRSYRFPLISPCGRFAGRLW